MILLLTIILIVMVGEYCYWTGYQKGYDSAKEIYDETCGPDRYILNHKKTWDDVNEELHK